MNHRSSLLLMGLSAGIVGCFARDWLIAFGEVRVIKREVNEWTVRVPSDYADREQEIKIYASPDGIEVEYCTISWEELYEAMLLVPSRRKLRMIASACKDRA